jgi:putative hydrolase of the HAD superfamily
VKAVTFDFWNTLMWERPESLKRSRVEYWAENWETGTTGIDVGRLDRAHDAAHQEYVRSWTEGRQFRVEDAVAHMLDDLGERDELVAETLMKGFSEAGRRAAVYPTTGVHECLNALTGGGVRLGIICDIGLTPSSVVRELLDREDLTRFFDSMSFSDEVGHYKPDRAIFEHALNGLEVPPEQAAHVGDRVRTDVRGAASMGMISVLYNGIYEDEELPGTDADIVVADLPSLPRLLEMLEVSV